MTPKQLLEKYTVNLDWVKLPKVKAVKKSKNANFFDLAKKHIIHSRSKRKTNLSLNVDKILYGKK